MAQIRSGGVTPTNQSNDRFKHLELSREVHVFTDFVSGELLVETILFNCFIIEVSKVFYYLQEQLTATF